MPKGSGRRPLPTAVKKLRGNPGKRKLNDREPTVAAGEPKMPRDLPAAAAAEWRRIVPELRQLGVLATIDRAALAAYCHAYARWFEAEELVKKLGILLKEPIMGHAIGEDEDGEIVIVDYRYKKNPAVTVSESATKSMKSFLVEFGMTPSSRSRVRIDKPAAEADPMEEFLQSANGAPNKHVN